MPRGSLSVETLSASREREAEYHEWYDETHLQETVTPEGSARAPLRGGERRRSTGRDLGDLCR